MLGRVARLRTAMAEDAAEAFLITSATNRRYLSGFTGSAGWLLITSDEAYVLTDFRYVIQVGREAPDFTLIETSDLVTALAKLVQDKGIKRIAVEAAHTTLAEQARREEAMPQVEWLRTTGVVEKLRAVKEPEEIQRIEAAVALADQAFAYIVERLVGRTEQDVARDLEFYMREQGAQRIAFSTIVASGPNGALPHAVPTDRTIQRGDLVTLDFGAVLDGYCSDVTRTVGVGPLDDKQREVYALVLKAEEVGVEAVRPGRLGKEVDADARQVIDAAGYGAAFGHGLGHGIGMEVHEDPPRLSPKGEARLEVGMVSSVEPGVYLEGWGGVRIEDLVVVTQDGCRVLTRAPKELIEL